MIPLQNWLITFLSIAILLDLHSKAVLFSHLHLHSVVVFDLLHQDALNNRHAAFAYLPDPHESVVSILHHMFSPRVLHMPGYFRPSQSVLVYKLEEKDVLLRAPMAPLDQWVQVVVPLFPTVVQVPEKYAARLGEDPVGNPPPVHPITAVAVPHIGLHNFLKHLGLFLRP